MLPNPYELAAEPRRGSHPSRTHADRFGYHDPRGFFWFVGVAVALLAWVIADPAQTATAAVVGFCLFVAIASWLSFAPDRRFRRELAGRAPLDDEQFFAKFYAGTRVDPDVPRRLRPIYCEVFGIDVEKMRPTDRPPLVCEIDTSELVTDIEQEFGVAISDEEAEGIDGSFDSIVRFLSERQVRDLSRW
ncbi:MAG: acyl carrier protein [Planctomycetes bacterium]|nr:acyl carrier protein [Planctomycetota bacterium]